MFKRKKRIVLSLRIDENACIGCESCVARCRRKVLGMTDDGEKYYAGVEYPEDCVGCGKCLKVCPANAIELKTEIINSAFFMSFR